MNKNSPFLRRLPYNGQGCQQQQMSRIIITQIIITIQMPSNSPCRNWSVESVINIYMKMCENYNYFTVITSEK